MTTKEQARKVKNYLGKTFSVSAGISHDESGYFVKVHLSCYSSHNIPNEIEGVKIETVTVGTPRTYQEFKTEAGIIEKKWEKISATDADNTFEIALQLWNLNKEMLASIRKLEEI